MVGISGYGNGGPYAKARAYDLLAQSEGGSCAITGVDGRPAIGPRCSSFNLRHKRQQRRLARGEAYELHTEWKAIFALIQRQRDPGLPTRIENRRKRREQA